MRSPSPTPTGLEPVEQPCELDRLIHALFRGMSNRPHARDQLRKAAIEAGLPFATRLARHYQGRGEPFDDLVQVATVGLIKAIDGYDPERGLFTHYARPTIAGELKKHFRDRGWSVRVPRRLQELKMDMARAFQTLTQKLGRVPSIEELAQYLGLDEGLVIEGLGLAHAYQPASLDAPVSPEDDASVLGALLGVHDPAVESLPDRVTLAMLLLHLPEREGRILHLRFWGNMTQNQIAAEMGISQMHVSRLIAGVLEWLRSAMNADDPVLPWRGATSTTPPNPNAPRIEVGHEPGGIVVVTVVGAVNKSNAPRLQQTLCGTAIARRPREVRVGLARVPRLASAGVDALLVGRQAAQRGGIRFTLTRPHRSIVDTLHQAGLSPLLYR